jgi:hypothetical protein
MANTIHTDAITAMGYDQRPRYHGPGRRRSAPQMTREIMGMPYAKYRPMMLRQKMALGVSGALQVKRRG